MQEQMRHEGRRSPRSPVPRCDSCPEAVEIALHSWPPSVLLFIERTSWQGSEVTKEDPAPDNDREEARDVGAGPPHLQSRPKPKAAAGALTVSGNVKWQRLAGGWNGTPPPIHDRPGSAGTGWAAQRDSTAGNETPGTFDTSACLVPILAGY